MAKKIIYLDNASTTALDSAVFGAIKPYFTDKYGNPSNIYNLGQEAKKAVEKARKQTADFLNCRPEEIFFTSGATESNNLAIQGIVKKFKEQNPGQKPHIIASAIEHPSVLNICSALKRDGLAEVTFLKVNQQGFVDSKDVNKYLRPSTILVSVIYANNEIGSIQPLKEISKIVSNNKKETGYPLFHTDAVQAINYLDCSVRHLGVDLLTFNAHKIYGPKGIGVLYIKQGTAIAPLVYGGGQEKDLRSGTENVAGIVGIGQAVAMIKNPSSCALKAEKLKNRLINKILKNIEEAKINSPQKNCLPNIVSISFKRAEGESVVYALSEKGICVSTGSACASKTLKPSYVLTAIGLSPIAAHCSVRFSLGKYTSIKDIDYTVKVLAKEIKRLRSIAGK